MNSTEKRPVAWEHIRLALVILVAWGGVNVVVVLVLNAHELHQLAREHEIAPDVLRQFEARRIDLPTSSASNAFSLSYRLRPPNRWSGDHTVPLIVCLHGSGDRGADNVQQLSGFVSALCQDEVANAFPCAILAPQCPVGFTWSSHIDATTDVLDGMLMMIDDVLQDDSIDRNRVYLVGYSMGGFGAWELAARNTEKFAAVVLIAGGGDPELGKALVGLPLWAIHGLDDEVVPIEGSRKLVEAIRDAGGDPQFSELTSVGHRAWTEVVRPDSGVLTWLFQQKRRGSQVEHGPVDTSAI